MPSPSGITIHRTFFCDDISEGPHKKLNLSGYIPSKSIAIDVSPYVFDSNLVAEATLQKEFTGAELIIRIAFIDENGSSVGDASLSLSVPSPLDETRLLLIAKTKFRIVFGTMMVEILLGDVSIFSDEFKIVHGEAPNIEVIGEIDSSAIVSQGINLSLIPIIGSASRELIVIDSHLTPNAVPMLLSSIMPQAVVKILVSPHYKTTFAQEMPNLRMLVPSIEIRFSKAFHDRFIIVNGTEYFHFGHSLKDLLNSKVSRYAKITKKEEIDNLSALFNSEWQKATLLP